jgi:hypothetical protein
MWRYDESARAPGFQRSDVIEGAHIFGAIREIDEQDMPPINRPFNPRNHGDPALQRIIDEPAVDELSIVEGQSKRIESKHGRAVYQGQRIVRNVVYWIFTAVKVKVYFQNAHVRIHVRVTVSKGRSGARTHENAL